MFRFRFRLCGGFRWHVGNGVMYLCVCMSCESAEGGREVVLICIYS